MELRVELHVQVGSETARIAIADAAAVVAIAGWGGPACVIVFPLGIAFAVIGIGGRPTSVLVLPAPFCCVGGAGRGRLVAVAWQGVYRG